MARNAYTTIDWDTIITPGVYTMILDSFSQTSANYPENIYQYGLLYVTLGVEDGIQQVYIPHVYDNYTNYILAHRMKWNKDVGFGPWNYVPKIDSIPVNRLPIVTNDYNNYKVPGVYEIYYDHTEESTPPQNHTPIDYGQLLVFNANNINNNVSQIAIDKYTQYIYFRTFNDVWTNWQQIHPDYTSISLNTNGFIIFNNGLILQWTSISYTASDFSWISGWYRAYAPYPINFTNEPLLFVGCNIGQFDASKPLPRISYGRETVNGKWVNRLATSANEVYYDGTVAVWTIGY